MARQKARTRLNKSRQIPKQLVLPLSEPFYSLCVKPRDNKQPALMTFRSYRPYLLPLAPGDTCHGSAGALPHAQPHAAGSMRDRPERPTGAQSQMRLPLSIAFNHRFSQLLANLKPISKSGNINIMKNQTAEVSVAAAVLKSAARRGPDAGRRRRGNCAKMPEQMEHDKYNSNAVQPICSISPEIRGGLTNRFELLDSYLFKF